MDYKVGDIVKTKKPHPCGSNEWEITRIGLDFKLKCKRMWTCFDDFKRKSLKNNKIIFGDFNMHKIQKFLVSLIVIVFLENLIIGVPTIADWGDYDMYDGSSSYDDWGGSSSSSSWSDDDWSSSSSSSSWGSSWDDDYYGSGSSYRSSSSSSGGSPIIVFGTLGFFVLIILLYISTKKHYKEEDELYNRTVNNRRMDDILARRAENRNVIFGTSDKEIEDKIQLEDPLFNKSEFLAWASDMFVKLQYAWSDRNLEDIRYFITPELYEQTNGQVQRYITNKQINKLERVSVNISRLYSYEQQGDRDILRVVLESKMIDYIIDENTGNVLRGDPALNIVNPYILTFVRKTGVKTEEGEIKPVTMNCPNCGGATTILSSGKCPYCGSIITTRDNNWALSELKRYNPNV